ncbi:hypothetical protein EV715DRAFT_298133 [Schizophyllum commune]
MTTDLVPIDVDVVLEPTRPPTFYDEHGTHRRTRQRPRRGFVVSRAPTSADLAATRAPATRRRGRRPRVHGELRLHERARRLPSRLTSASTRTSYHAISPTRWAMPDDVETDVDACAAQRRFDRAGNGRNSHVHLAETPRSLLETPSTISLRTYDDADVPLDGTSKPAGGILVKMCPATLPRCRELVPRPGRGRTAAFTDVDIDLDDAEVKPKLFLTIFRPARYSTRRNTRCCSLTVLSSGSDLSTDCYFIDASKMRGQREALPCNPLDFVDSIVYNPSMRRRGMSLSLRLVLSLSMTRMRLVALPSLL